VVLAAVSDDGAALQYAHPALQADREVVLTAVVRNGSALRYAEESLRADPEVVLAAVLQQHFAFQYAHESLRGDVNFLGKVLSMEPVALKFAALQGLSDEALSLLASQTTTWLVLKISLLSGRSCVVTCRVQRHVCDVMSQCRRLLDLESGQAEQQKLVSQGHVLEAGVPLSEAEAISVGKLNHLVLIREYHDGREHLAMM